MQENAEWPPSPEKWAWMTAQIMEAQRRHGRKPKTYRCKIGTIPGMIILYKNSRPRVGRRIQFRDYQLYDKWETGIVNRIDPIDGFLFIERF